MVTCRLANHSIYSRLATCSFAWRKHTRQPISLLIYSVTGPGPMATSSGTRLPADKLALYVSSGIEYLKNDTGKPGDPLKWWREHCDMYARLAAMALDYLSISCMYLIPDVS